jgi:hypothetical protein
MIVISCYFGSANTNINKAPMGSKCFFFSNNLKIKKKVTTMRWKFIYVDHLPMTKDYRISSLQSKYVKFLQFNKKHIGWVEGDSIMYFDHKLDVQQNHVKQAKNLCKTEILIKNHPTQNLLEDEVEDSIKQKRYAKTMDKTIEWIDSTINSGNYSKKNMMMATGFILFADVKAAQQLCDEVYNTCVELGQPECQIIWGVLSQKFEKSLTRIGWKEIDIGKAPYSFAIRASAYIKRVIKRMLNRL